MVVLAIMTILTTVFLLQQRRFDSSTLLRTLAYSIALSVRQAQTYGSSVRQFDTSANGFKYSYGLSFSTDANHYYLFADVNGDKIYETSPTDETVQKFTINTGYSITKFCGILPNGTDQSCTTGTTPGGTPITSLTLYFKRPDPDAQFSATNSAGNANGETYCAVYVQVQGGGGDTRAIKITTTGQVLIGPPNPLVTDPSVSGC